MSSVSTTLRMFDMMTNPMMNVVSSLNVAVSSMDNLANAANRDITLDNSLNAVTNSVDNATVSMNQMVAQQDMVSNSQQRMNNTFNNAQRSTDGLMRKVRGLFGAYLSIQALIKGMNITDNYINQNSRLELINDALQSQVELQNKIYQAAQRSRGEYGATVNTVAKLGLLARDAFSSNNEAIAFAELMNKSFKISGASASEASNGMYQLTQAMAAGRLQGDEFRSVMENAPMLAQAIANYTGKSMGQLREMSSEGKITANIIKGALFSAADDINAKFNTMPMTFGTIWTSVKNKAVVEFSGIMQEVNSFINSNAGITVINGLTNAMGGLASITGFILNTVMIITSIFAGNWSIIAPIILGIAGALGVYYLAVLAVNTVTTISKGLELAAAIAKAIHTRATLAKTSATAAETAAQWGLNSAILACPITWIIIGIIALIAIFYAAIAAVNHFTGTSLSATGMIGGGFAVLGAAIWNTVIGVINAIIQFMWTGFVEPWIGAIEWVLNVFNGGFNSFGDAVKNLLGNIISWFLSLGKIVTNIIDSIFGTNWTDGLNSLQKNILSWGKNDNAISLSREAPLINSRIEYGNAYSTGYNWGKGIDSKVSSVFGGFKMPGTLTGPSELSMINDSVKNIDDKIDVSNEHLEILRDLAEQESIQNFVTLTPTVQVTTGDIREEVDINKIIAKIENYMETELVNSAEGVYA
jgi:tape measure domain-containing protein